MYFIWSNSLSEVILLKCLLHSETYRFVSWQHLIINKRAFSFFFFLSWSLWYKKAPPPILPAPLLSFHCCQLMSLSYIQKHCNRCVLFSPWVSTRLCLKRIVGSWTLNLEQEWCVPRISVLIVILTGRGPGMCCPAAQLHGCLIAWPGEGFRKQRCAHSPPVNLALLGRESQGGLTCAFLWHFLEETGDWVLAFLHSCGFLEELPECGR